MQTVLIVMFVLVCCYILYLLELLPIRGGYRAGFVGRICGERTRCNAGFTRYTGYIRRVVRLQGGRTYHFRMKGKISHGSLTAILWDRKCKNRLLELSPGESGTVELSAPERCRLELRFESASGNFVLHWEEDSGI